MIWIHLKYEILKIILQNVFIKKFLKQEMDSTNLKLIITANSINAATWGFHYYLKYYCNSSVYWSGKKINIDKILPKVPEKITITAND